MDISKNIKKYRRKKGFTQEALSRKANISYNTIIKIETEGIKDPRISTVEKIANVFDISIDELVGRNNKFTYK